MNSSPNSQNRARPWWSFGHVWLLISGPAIVVVAAALFSTWLVLLLLPLVALIISLLGAITFGQLQLLQTLQAGQQVARALQLGVGEGAAGALASNLGITYSMAGQNPITADSNVRCLLTRTVASGPFGLMLPAQRVCFLQVGE